MMQTETVVILADGRFPEHSIPLKLLSETQKIVCCDGAVDKLVAFGREPYAIIGDLDSITPSLRERYQSIIHQDADQEYNDLTKSVMWCKEQGFSRVAILGATGRREDHAIGNISLLADKYCQLLDAKMYTNFGIFSVIFKSTTFHSYPGQQVSFFAMDNAQRVTFRGLKYPLTRAALPAWWMATLNETLGDQFEVELETDSPLIVFMNY